MKPLALATSNDTPAPQEFTINVGIDKAVKVAKAARPTVALIVWETADGTMAYKAVPNSPSLANGLIDALYRRIHPDVFDDD
jgi:hypothetical protein